MCVGVWVLGDKSEYWIFDYTAVEFHLLFVGVVFSKTLCEWIADDFQLSYLQSEWINYCKYIFD